MGLNSDIHYERIALWGRNMFKHAQIVLGH